MPKLNLAVIGIGNMGQNHARIYSELPNVNLVAVCDVNKQQGEELGKKFNCLFYKDCKKSFALLFLRII